MARPTALDTPYMPTGPFRELEGLDLGEVLAHLAVYTAGYLPDSDTCMRYAAAIMRHEGWHTDPSAVERMGMLVGRALALAPFDVRVVGLACRLSGDEKLVTRLALLEKMDRDPSIWNLSGCLSSTAIRAKKRRFLLDRLAREKGNVLVASQLLALDLLDGASPQWLADFYPPEPVAEQWVRRLFLHLASVLDTEGALALWPQVEAMGPGPLEWNQAAELFRRQGAAERAKVCYRISLEQDPGQEPVVRRLAELENPTAFDADPTGRKVEICLYSWNKAEMLGRTLAGLAATEIGDARITVLLNGCADDSAAVARAARETFPDNAFSVIELPVNVGAPAARNWLVNRIETWESRYLAFLDDDVTLPRHWLRRLLSVAEARPKAGVVGAKVLFPGVPPMVQYLYRDVAVAKKNCIKLTEPAPVALYDTGLYDVVRSTANVMGCCHLLRVDALKEVPEFDLRFSPSQIDDIAHDIELRLAGWEVVYCGHVSCVHHQASGASFSKHIDDAALGQVLGNDIKFYYKFSSHIKALKNL